MNTSDNLGLVFSLIIGIVLTVIILFIYIFSSIRKNRFLYGKSYGMIVGAVVAILTVVSLTCGILSIAKVDATDILDWDINEDSRIIPTIDNDSILVKENVESKEEMYSNDTVPLYWAVVSQFADPGNLPSAHKKGRGWALLCALLGIVCLSGFSITSIVNVISKRSEKWKAGYIHYKSLKYRLFPRIWKYRKHVVIIGVNEQTVGIVKQSLKRQDVGYVLIQTRQDVNKMRMRLDLGLDDNEEKRVVFYFAERTSLQDIEKLNLKDAKEVYILGEDVSYKNEEDHDAFNIECLELISKHIKVKGKSSQRLKCNVAFEYQSTFTAFKLTHIYQQLDKHVEFIPFNVHELWAKKVLVDNFAIIPGDELGTTKVQRYKSLDGDGIKIEDDKIVHLVILGMNQMGTALAVQAALIAHYPNFIRDNKLKTIITFVDDHAKEEGEFFRGRFQNLFDLSCWRFIDIGNEKNESDGLEYNEISKYFEPSENLKKRTIHLVEDGEDLMDIQWEFIQGNVASSQIKSYLSSICNDSNKIATIAICFNSPHVSTAAAMCLPKVVLKEACQILVYQPNSFYIINTVAEGDKEWRQYEKIVPFGIIESSYREDVFDNMLAKVEHYSYSKKKSDRQKEKDYEFMYELYKKLINGEIDNYSLVKDIEREWEELGIVQKLANIDMVDSIPTKLRSMGLKDDGNIKNVIDFFCGDKLSEDEIKRRFDLFSQSEHIRWMMERLIMGYRALTESEQSKIEKYDELTKAEVIEMSIHKHRAHLDICSNNKLKKVNKAMSCLDLDVIAYLPVVLRYSNWAIMMKLINNSDNFNVASNLVGGVEDFKIKFIEKYKKRESNQEESLVEKRVKEIAKLFKTEKECENKMVRNHSFWIFDFPVTQKIWSDVMGQEKKDWKNLLGWMKYKCPVVNVSKDEIDNFLLVLRKETGLYFALPSLKEWRYAAMLSTKYLDDTIANKEMTEEDKLKRFKKYICVYGKSPIGSGHNNKKQNNDFEVYDMLGNVWEWTRTSAKDVNHENCFYFCGGSWHFKHKECNLYDEQSYWNSFWLPKLKSKDVGFRLIWKFDDEILSKMLLQSVGDVVSKKLKSAKTVKEMDDNMLVVEKWLLDHMVEIEEGLFMMGTENKDTNNDFCFLDEFAGVEETPHHYVKISKFQISRIPVTQKLWNAVMGILPKENPSDVIGDDYPQTNISYRTILDDFIPKLNYIIKEINLIHPETKLKPDLYRIPTEAEWEYVAKGGHKTDFCKLLENKCKNDGVNKFDEVLNSCDKNPYSLYSGSDKAREVAYFSEKNIKKVFGKKPNVCGVYDMSGNIWEWVLDYYQTNYYNDCIKTEEYKENGYIVNPVCNDSSYSAHVFRGGSWCFPKSDSRCTSVNFWVDTDEDNDLGFRLACGINANIHMKDFEYKSKSLIQQVKRKIKRP